MKILLTGSGGFVGKNLKSYLFEKYELLCPRSFELDLRNLEDVKRFFNNNEVDFIIHCGSTGGVRGIEDNDTTIDDNLAMVNNLIKSKKDEVRMILFGSGAMYGKDRNLHKVTESNIGEYIPKDLYGQSKLEISKIVEQRKDILMLNIFGCYGFEEKENRFPSYAIKQNLTHQNIDINQDCIFDYLWVEDMAKIVAYFIEHKSTNKIINITPKNSVSLKEIAEIVNKVSNFESNITVINPTISYEYTGSNDVLLSEIKNFEFTPIEIGIKKLYEFNKKNLVNI